MINGDFIDDPHIGRIARALWNRDSAGSATVLVGAGFSRNATPIRPSGRVMPGWNDIYVTMVEQLYPVPGGAGTDQGGDRATAPAQANAIGC